MGCDNWFHHTDMINLFYQNLTFAWRVNTCLDIFLQKNIIHGFYSLTDSKVIEMRYFKFPSVIRELPYKLRTGKERNRPNSIYASLSGRLTGYF